MGSSFFAKITDCVIENNKRRMINDTIYNSVTYIAVIISNRDSCGERRRIGIYSDIRRCNCMHCVYRVIDQIII